MDVFKQVPLRQQRKAVQYIHSLHQQTRQFRRQANETLEAAKAEVEQMILGASLD
jgi:hypothetical protein